MAIALVLTLFAGGLVGYAARGPPTVEVRTTTYRGDGSGGETKAPLVARRAVGWRQRFAALAGMPERVLSEFDGIPEDSLYRRLGGEFGIAHVVSVFSDRLLDDSVVGFGSSNRKLAAWNRELAPTRLAGVKCKRTTWLCQVAGGHQRLVPSNGFMAKAGAGASDAARLNLTRAHCPFEMKSEEFDAVLGVLRQTMIDLRVGEREIAEVVAAFNDHRAEVTFCGYHPSMVAGVTAGDTRPFGVLYEAR